MRTFDAKRLCCQLNNSAADYHAIRAVIRVKAQVVSMIHEKALKCKDLGGLVKKAEKESEKASKGEAEAGDSSSVGRVVSLMSS